MLRFLVVAGASLIGGTIAVGVLQDVLGVPNPSSLYLLAVVATAVVSGPWGAAAAAAAAFLLYNFLFVEPRYTLSVAHLGELVNLFLLLFVGFVVGQLAARLRARAEDALAREREALAQFQVSRELATRASTSAALTRLAPIVGREAGMQRVWIALGDGAAERTAADTLASEGRPPVGLHNVLQRMPGDTPARWVRVHMPTSSRGRPFPAWTPTGCGSRPAASRTAPSGRYRPHGRGEPTPTESRLLAAAADQIGQALHQDRLAAEAQAAEVAREGDAIKSALLQSVSHDLRTPLATIRAAAGTLRPGAGVSEQDQQASADAIDREVEYLNRLVTNLLDLSRIEAGALRAEREVFELDDLVGQTIGRLRARLGDRPLEVALDVPPVSVDPIFLDEAVTNILENAVKYTPPGTRVRVAARSIGAGTIRLTIEDAGAGVPPASLDRLFEKFYRVPGQSRASRSGTGIGLAVVRGLMEAMGGRAVARPSELGGLAVDLDLVAAPKPPAAIASTTPPEHPA